MKAPHRRAKDVTLRPDADAALVARERQRLQALRMQLLEMHPFWGYLLLQMRLVPAPELPTFGATDCVRHIWYNPHLTRHLTNAELGFVLVHELGHQVYETQARQAGRDHLRWNMATDYAINRIVSQIQDPATRNAKPMYQPVNRKIPGLGKVQLLLDHKYDGLIAEAIYERLCQQELGGPRYLTIELRTGAAGNEAGSHLHFPNVADHGGGIDVHLPIELSPEQRELVRDRIAAAVENWQANQQQGALPGDRLRELGLLDKPRIPWQRVLHRFADLALAREEYALARPNKRYLEHDIVVPGLYDHKVGRVVVAVDTSGSMGQTELAAVAKEIRGIAANAEEVLLIIADAKVQEVVPFARFEEFMHAGKFKGGGGTDHRPVFQRIQDDHMDPTLFIGLTDLFSSFPDARPAFPVIWVTPKDHGKAPWGQVIEANA